MACYHLSAAGSGESRISELLLPTRETEAGIVQGVSEIPTTTMGFGAFVGRKPDVGMHQAPRRQFLVVLRGVLEIVTSVGQREELRSGDVLLADDIGTDGHISRDVGEEPLMLMAIGIGESWQGPSDEFENAAPRAQYPQDPL
jgi:hypothetical protein